MTSHEVLSLVLVPAISGLAAGFLTGLITGILATLRWVANRRERDELMPIYTDETNPDPGHTPWRGREHLSKLGWALLLLGVLGLIGGTISLYQSNHTQNCLRTYIEQSSAANKERSEAGELDRQAIRQQRAVTQEFNNVLIDSITNPPKDDAAREQARQGFLVKANDWNARLAKVDELDRAADQQRRDNPLPGVPNCS